MSDGKNVYCGGIWQKKTRGGQDYLSLSLDLTKLLKSLGFNFEEELKVNLAGFKNDRKKSDNSPDFSISYLPKDK